MEILACLGCSKGSRLCFATKGWRLGIRMYLEDLGVGRERGGGEGLGRVGFGVGVEGAGVLVP